MMIMENDKFRVPEKYLRMSVAELDKAIEYKERDLLKKKAAECTLSKNTKNPCSVRFHLS